jgi:hypothetical protein
MVNLENHEGSFCVYTSVFCQEGYCSGCEIYRKRPSATKQADLCAGVKSRKVSRLVLIH